MASKRVKVLEVLEAAGGGALVHLFQIVEHVSRDEFEVTVAISPRRMADAEGEVARLRRLGARVELVPMRRRIAPLSDFSALLRLVRLLRRERYDVVHAHSSKAGFLGRLAARRAGAGRVFYTPHAFAFQCGGVRGRVYERLERVAAGFGGMIVAVSEGERRLAVERGIVPSDRVVLVRNAIEPPAEATAAERAAARAALSLPADAAVAGTVGRLARQKGYGDLVRAAALVPGDVRFVVIGAGPLLRQLRGLAERLGVGGRVTFAGHRADAARLYAAMDVYVQPSLWEGLSYSLLEAMGRGLGVVATDVPGNADVVRPGETGLLVPVSEPRALAEGVGSLLADAGSRARLGRAARELVLREHRLADFVRSIEALYRGSY